MVFVMVFNSSLKNISTKLYAVSANTAAKNSIKFIWKFFSREIKCSEKEYC